MDVQDVDEEAEAKAAAEEKAAQEAFATGKDVELEDIVFKGSSNEEGQEMIGHEEADSAFAASNPWGGSYRGIQLEEEEIHSDEEGGQPGPALPTANEGAAAAVKAEDAMPQAAAAEAPQRPMKAEPMGVRINLTSLSRAVVGGGTAGVAAAEGSSKVKSELPAAPPASSSSAAVKQENGDTARQQQGRNGAAAMATPQGSRREGTADTAVAPAATQQDMAAFKQRKVGKGMKKRKRQRTA